VDKAGCVKLSGNVYEVDTALAGQKIQLRYDPFDLTEVQAWQEDKRFGDAKPMELQRKRMKKKEEPELKATPQPESLSFLELAEAKRQAVWQDDELRYAGKGGGRS
jgi:putative transposase